jgi:hypothetical protein
MARMKYAQGGIIGFSGKDPDVGSKVPDPESDSELFSGLPEESGLRQIAKWIKGGAKTPEWLEAARRPPLEKPLIEMLADRLRESPAAAPQPAAQPSARDAGGGRGFVNPSSGASSGPTSGPASGQTGQRQPSAPAVPQNPLAGLPEAPTPAGMFGAANAAVGVNPAIAEMERLGRERKELVGKRPDVETDAINAIREAQKQQQELTERQRGGDFFRRIGAFGGDLANRFSGDKLNNLDAAIAKRDSESIEAAKAAKMAEIKLVELAHAKKVGDVDAAIGLEKQIGELREKQTGHMINAAQASSAISGQVYQSQVGFMSQRAHDEAMKQLELMRRQTQMMKGPDQQMVEKLVNFKLSSLPDGGTPQQKLEAYSEALQTVRGAGRAESVEMQNRKAAFDLLQKWVDKNATQKIADPVQYAKDLEAQKQLIFSNFNIPTTSGANPNRTKYDSNGNPI